MMRQLLVVLSATLATFTAGSCSTGSDSPTTPTPSPDGSHTASGPVHPSAGRSGPCDPVRSLTCSTRPQRRYTIAQARSFLLTHHQVDKREFPHKWSRADQTPVFAVCEWQEGQIGIAPNVRDVFSRKWGDVSKYSLSSKSQQTYSQLAVAFPNAGKAQEAVAIWRRPCMYQSTDTAEHVNGWTHHRRVQQIRCITYGRCSKVVDMLVRDNVILLGAYAQVMGHERGNMAHTMNEADRMYYQVLKKTQAQD